MAKNTITQVQKFLGLNEAADGFRELALGEASVAENWEITDGFNIHLRPGIRKSMDSAGVPVAMWAGYAGEKYYMVTAIQHPELGENYTDINLIAWKSGAFRIVETVSVYHGYGKTVVKIFSLFSTVYVAVGADLYSIIHEYDGTPHLQPESPYIPIVITGSAPAGGGDILENLNILSDYARIQFSADGEATAYTMPNNCGKVQEVMVDNEIVQNAGTFDAETKVFTFTSAPAEGVNNVEITYEIETNDLLEAREKFARMPYCEAYNGTTDSRLFFYGDGSNITYYTGVTEYGRASALYIPAGNEISVDMSGSPITGATRHLSKLLFFKPDCTATVTYEPMTLADGRTIAGFTMKTIHREHGNTPYGQVEIVNNNPRSIGNGNLYEWVLPNVYSPDERNAKVISDRICKSLAAADMEKIVTLDDSEENTYYIFLNDEAGTVLANRYNLGTWTLYKSEMFRGVKYACMYGSFACFLREEDGMTDFCYLDSSYRYDNGIPIVARWHTGYMDFKADYRKKYSSSVWVSILPEAASRCNITASTDRRETYTVKQVGASIYNYGAVRYAYWTYSGKHAPAIRKVKLKVKKFVYYKLIFEITDPGATATILGYDQQIRIGSEVK